MILLDDTEAGFEASPSALRRHDAHEAGFVTLFLIVIWYAKPRQSFHKCRKIVCQHRSNPVTAGRSSKTKEFCRESRALIGCKICHLKRS